MTDTYVLNTLEVYNWGPFNGMHRAPIHPKGSAIIGTTASGKTTLIDALMTLLVKMPRYNLASTGGHESDRDLNSYIRGVHGDGAEQTDRLRHIRRGATVTGLCATLTSGEHQVRLGAIFRFDGQSSSASDRKSLWVFSDGPHESLDNWLTIHHDGGTRALNTYARDTSGIMITATKTKYLAQLRRFFETGENAFGLLNRAAGLKQLNNINEIFRDYVLEDNAAFERASQVVTEFSDLAAIREELETARRQQASLVPVRSAHKTWLSIDAKLKTQRALLELLPVWFARCGAELWQTELETLSASIAEQEQTERRLELEKRDLKQQEDRLQQVFLDSGGAKIAQLKEHITQLDQQLAERNVTLDQYRRIAKDLKLDDTASVAALEANKKHAARLRDNAREEHTAQQEQVFACGAQVFSAKTRCGDLAAEMKQVKQRPDSNLPVRYQAFRSDLAAALNLPESDLPFVAELLEVREDEKAWRGAIERALGAHRLRLLVPELVLDRALQWVNHRDNRLNVRLLKAEQPSGAAEFFHDSFLRKLRFKTHPLREPLKAFLSHRCDRHCVDDTGNLRDQPYSMTAQGLMSNAAGLYDKLDQRPLNQDWMTGFDNRDRIASVRAAYRDAHEVLAQAEHQFEQSRTVVAALEQKLAIVENLCALEFDAIDVASAEQRIATLRGDLAALEASSSKASIAAKQLDDIRSRIAGMDQAIKKLAGDLGVLRGELGRADVALAKATRRAEPALTAEQIEQATQTLITPTLDQIGQLDDLERAQLAEAQQRRDTLLEQQATTHRRIEVAMTKAKNVDTGALAETGSKLADIDDYLARYKVLTKEALPEKLDRFLKYLNQSSDQGVTQLLVSIDSAVNMIEERLDELNDTLGRVSYKSTRFLQIISTRVAQQGLRELHIAQKALRTAMLQDDEGESHYRALRHVVDILANACERRRTLGAKALLDPRFRLTFSVSVIDKESGATVETLTGSQGGSGGEKELIASYILTASLSYALCAPGVARPKFGSVVLDEAFSKTSQRTAQGIVEALRAFGLHPIFVTPNKEMQLLKSNTRSVVLVHRKGAAATLTSFDWETLAKQAAAHSPLP